MKATLLTAQLKCLYTNAHSMGNKQEELEATVLLESYDPIAITQTWWDKSHDWRGLLVATGCSEGSGKEGGAETLPSTSSNVMSLKRCP